MKKFKYTWCNDYYLLHIQLDNSQALEFEIFIHRDYQEKGLKTEKVLIKKDPSYRFMVSRTHPKECGFLLEYPEEIVLEAFKLDDRAYYPTESFFKG